MKWTIEKDGVTVPVQYDLRQDPWRVIVSCIMLNQSGGHQVRDPLSSIFERWPVSYAFLTARRDDVESIMRPAGLGRIKAIRALMMTRDWCSGEREVGRLYGCGQYAADAVEIFCNRKMVRAPSDNFLALWVHTRQAAKFFESGRI